MTEMTSTTTTEAAASVQFQTRRPDVTGTLIVFSIITSRELSVISWSGSANGNDVWLC